MQDLESWGEGCGESVRGDVTKLDHGENGGGPLG